MKTAELLKRLRSNVRWARDEGYTGTAQTLTTAVKHIEAMERAIDAEPELPGDMPDEMWNAIKGDRDAVQEAMRIAVRQTKSGIKKRIGELCGDNGSA